MYKVFSNEKSMNLICHIPDENTQDKRPSAQHFEIDFRASKNPKHGSVGTLNTRLFSI